MLAKEIDGTAFRLMGTGVSALRPGSQADDTDMLDRRSAHAERAIDDLRKKFGNAAVIRGIAYEGPEKAEETRRIVTPSLRGASDEAIDPRCNARSSSRTRVRTTGSAVTYTAWNP